MSTPSLAAQLEALGVGRGSVAMLHVGMRSVGGRAEALLDALQAVVGPEGTLVMVLGADPDEPFDRLRTPVDVEDMGVFAEAFRRRCGEHVSDHAAARAGALGPAAEHLLRSPPLHDYYGPGSLLQRFTALPKAGVLRLGASPDTVTLTHHAEYLARLPHKRSTVYDVVRADIGAQSIRCLDDTHGIADWAGGDYFPQITADFVAAGHARVGPVGGCRAEWLPAEAFVDFAVAWLERELG